MVVARYRFGKASRPESRLCCSLDYLLREDAVAAAVLEVRQVEVGRLGLFYFKINSVSTGSGSLSHPISYILLTVRRRRSIKPWISKGIGPLYSAGHDCQKRGGQSVGVFLPGMSAPPSRLINATLSVAQRL